MKKTVIRIFAFLLAAVMLLSLAVTAFAAEVKRGVDEDALAELIRNGTAESFRNESLENASSSSHAGIFALEVKTSESNFVTTAFLLSKNGSVYLVTDTFLNKDLSSGSLTLKSTGGNYSQKATYLGADDFFVYLSASGLESFVPFTVGTTVYKTGRLYVEQVGKGLGYLELNLGEMDIYKLGNDGDYAIFNTARTPQALEIGAPIIDMESFTVFAIGSAGDHPETGNLTPAYFSFISVDLTESYALNGSSGGGAAKPDAPAEPEEPAKPEEPAEPEEPKEPEEPDDRDDGDDSRDDDGDAEEEEGFVFKPIYLAVIGVLVVVIFLIYRTNTRGGNAGPKPGTVAMEPTDTVQSEGDLPLNPGFDAVQSMGTGWQLKGISGSFSGQTFPLTGSLRLGRAPQCQIQFQSGTPGVSSNHCEITLEGGSVVLRDLGSTYGTFCKGSKLSPHAPCYLNPGDTFTLAQDQTFQLEAAIPAGPAGITVRDAQGREYRTGSDKMAFGRAAGSKVQFPADDKGVSSNHCVLYREDGKLYLMDVGSTNGTFFTEENRLKPNTPYRVRKGMAFFLVNRKNTFVVTED